MSPPKKTDVPTGVLASESTELFSAADAGCDVQAHMAPEGLHPVAPGSH